MKNKKWYALCFLISMFWAISSPAKELEEADYIILKWTSYPGHEFINEYFLSGHDVLYMIRYGNTDDALPTWFTSEVDEKGREAISTILDAAIADSKRRLDQDKRYGPRCHFGFQWGVKISVENEARIFGSKCDSPGVQDVISRVIENSFDAKTLYKINNKWKGEDPEEKSNH